MSRQSAVLNSATQHAMPPECDGKWGAECLNTRFYLPTLLCAGYSLKLKKKKETDVDFFVHTHIPRLVSVVYGLTYIHTIILFYLHKALRQKILKKIAFPYEFSEIKFN